MPKQLSKKVNRIISETYSKIQIDDRCVPLWQLINLCPFYWSPTITNLKTWPNLNKLSLTWISAVNYYPKIVKMSYTLLFFGLVLLSCVIRNTVYTNLHKTVQLQRYSDYYFYTLTSHVLGVIIVCGIFSLCRWERAIKLLCYKSKNINNFFF